MLWFLGLALAGDTTEFCIYDREAFVDPFSLPRPPIPWLTESHTLHAANSIRIRTNFAAEILVLPPVAPNLAQGPLPRPGKHTR